jgi:2-polyprenyl-3-methyl-5-hydroxy-6-metoxy-1,4-benzoquinol methylase
MECRGCSQLTRTRFLDLGFSPPSNSFLSEEEINSPILTFPLRIDYCDECWMVQTEDYLDPAIFFNSGYAYFSSVSNTWLQHSEEYARKMIGELFLTSQDLVLEIASNDGYLLQYFKEAEIEVLGIEPSTNSAQVARDKGIKTKDEFFGSSLASTLKNEGIKPKLIVANNVLAHVPDINDFIFGVKILLSPEGIATFEFPHLLNLIKFKQFDTIYHEHFSYLSLSTVSHILQKHGLDIYKVDEIPTHGGSLRVYARHLTPNSEESESFRNIINREIAFGLQDNSTYSEFAQQCKNVKFELLSFLLHAKKEGKVVVGYGAAAKGNTLLNYCGISSDLLPIIADNNPHKQGKYTPGSNIKIYPPSKLLEIGAIDYILILPWNLKDEIINQLADFREKGTKFIVAIPTLKVI